MAKVKPNSNAFPSQIIKLRFRFFHKHTIESYALTFRNVLRKFLRRNFEIRNFSNLESQSARKLQPERTATNEDCSSEIVSAFIARVWAGGGATQAWAYIPEC